jgi:hypothetical protein
MQHLKATSYSFFNIFKEKKTFLQLPIVHPRKRWFVSETQRWALRGSEENFIVKKFLQICSLKGAIWSKVCNVDFGNHRSNV